MDLLFVELIGAFFSLIFVVVSFIIAFKIIFRYFEYKARLLLLVGISWFGLTLPWITDAISLVLIVLINYPLNPLVKVIIELPCLPFFLVTWLTAFTEMLYKKKQQIIIIICIICSIIFEFVFFIILIIDFSLIGSFYPPMGIDYTPFILIYLFFIMGIFVITGIRFGLESLKSTNPEIKLKGKFLIIAFLSFLTGAVLDALLPLHPVWLIITRIILISSAIEYYFGFILPEWIRKTISANK
jgi:hypothetical protein